MGIPKLTLRADASREDGKMKRAKRDRGSVLCMVLIIMLAVAALGIGLLSLAQTDAVETARAYGDLRAFWAAEAGLAHVQAVALKEDKPFDEIGPSGSVGTR